MDVSIKDSFYFPNVYVSRSNDDISGLIAALNKGGVEIRPEDCQKKISYSSKREHVESRVPFLVDTEEHARVEGYFLRGEKLDINVEGHSEHHSSGLPGVIGSRLVSSGTRFDISFNGSCGGEEMVRKVGDVLNARYK